MAVNSIIKEEEAYSAFVREFKELEKQNEANRGDGKNERELKIMAQAALTKARLLRKSYESYLNIARSENNAADIKEFEERIAKIDSQIGKWNSKCQLYGSSLSGTPDTTFDDIAGLEDIKKTIRDYLYVLKHPDVAGDYSISTNLGILLYGPPGTGKTMFGEAIANELGLRYFVITPSKIFGAYVGESEKNIKDLFDELRACTDGSVLLVDECETIFAKRTSDGNRASVGVTNQLLQEMNGQGDLKTSKRVIVGATNRPEMIDEAYLRYKRFSLQCYVGLPEMSAKRKVIDLKLKKMNNSYTPEFRDALYMYARNHEYVTCADLSGIIEQCAFHAVTGMRELEDAIAKHDTQREREIRESETIVNNTRVLMSPHHLNKVIETYQLSVSPEMVKGYLEFRDKRRS